MTDNCVIVTSAHDLAGTTMSNYLIRKAEFTIGSNREGDNDGNSYRSLRHQNIQLHIFFGNLLTLENIEN
ncbi:MAG: hypothetical protein M3286_08090, partial [Thermoproteota archaeon]|nr:hypothetical protein [Thermoproteota archaeon]